MTATVSVPDPETDNGTGHLAASVSRNVGCTACDNVRQTGHDPLDWGRHCTTCHQSSHYACDECGACLPGRSRWDRYYCSSSCRVKVHAWRRSPEGLAQRKAQETWRDGPDGQQAVAMLRAMSEVMPGPKGPSETEREARDTAKVCGKCGVATPRTQPVWRRPARGYLGIPGRGAPLIPVCFACRCESWEGKHSAKRCDECHPRGQWLRVRWFCPRAFDPEHPSIYCDGCHPKAWRDPSPCEQCARSVMQSIYLRHDGRTVWRRDPNLPQWVEDWVRDRTFCSDECRAGYRAGQREAGRVRDPKPCAGCREHFTARTDAAYCSDACRQRAYRARKAVAVLA